MLLTMRLKIWPSFGQSGLHVFTAVVNAICRDKQDRVRAFIN